MLKKCDLLYYKARERAERDAAASAQCEASRDVHLRLADHYADRVWALEVQGLRSIARSIGASRH